MHVCCLKTPEQYYHNQPAITHYTGKNKLQEIFEEVNRNLIGQSCNAIHRTASLGQTTSTSTTEFGNTNGKQELCPKNVFTEKCLKNVAQLQQRKLLFCTYLIGYILCIYYILLRKMHYH